MVAREEENWREEWERKQENWREEEWERERNGCGGGFTGNIGAA